MLLIAFYRQPATESRKKISIKNMIAQCDPFGILILISAFVCLLFALEWAEITYPWSNAHVWGCLLGFVFLISAFLVLQVWHKDRSVLPTNSLLIHRDLLFD